jgi:hypothetical protein
MRCEGAESVRWERVAGEEAGMVADLGGEEPVGEVGREEEAMEVWERR